MGDENFQQRPVNTEKQAKSYGDFHPNVRLYPYVIAVWDQAKKGGTWTCLEHALKKGKKVFVVDPVEKTEGWYDEG